MSKSWEICIESSGKGTTIFKMLRLQILVDISCYKIWKWIDSQVGLDLLDLNNDQLWVLGQVTYIDRDPVTLVIWYNCYMHTRVSFALAYVMDFGMIISFWCHWMQFLCFIIPVYLWTKRCVKGRQCVSLSLYCLNTNTTLISLTIHLNFNFFILQMETLLTASRELF